MMANNRSSKKRSGIWFILAPILVIAILMYTKKRESNNLHSNIDTTILTTRPSYADIQKAKTDSEFQSISYPLREAFIIKNDAYFYSEPGFHQRENFVPFKEKVLHKAQKNGYLFCIYTFSTGNKDSGWILVNKVGNKKALERAIYDSPEEKYKRDMAAIEREINGDLSPEEKKRKNKADEEELLKQFEKSNP